MQKNNNKFSDLSWATFLSTGMVGCYKWVVQSGAVGQ